MAKNISIYPAEAFDLALSLNSWSKEHASASRSERINAVMDRYYFMIKNSEPSLTDDEWNIIYLSLSGCLFMQAASIANLARMIMNGAEDICQISEEDEGTEAAAFMTQAEQIVMKVRGMSFAQCVAIIERVERMRNEKLIPAAR